MQPETEGASASGTVREGWGRDPCQAFTPLARIAVPLRSDSVVPRDETIEFGMPSTSLRPYDALDGRAAKRRHGTRTGRQAGGESAPNITRARERPTSLTARRSSRDFLICRPA